MKTLKMVGVMIFIFTLFIAGELVAFQFLLARIPQPSPLLFGLISLLTCSGVVTMVGYFTVANRDWAKTKTELDEEIAENKQLHADLVKMRNRYRAEFEKRGSIEKRAAIAAIFALESVPNVEVPESEDLDELTMGKFGSKTTLRDLASHLRYMVGHYS